MSIDKSEDFIQVDETINADVVIVGSGVVGSMMAWRLSQYGIAVAIIEAGAEVDKTEAINRYRNSPDKGANSPYQMMPWAPVPDDEDPLSYYSQPLLPKCGCPQKPEEQIKFEGFFMRLVGGTSWHWTGHAERMFPNDFRMKTVYQRGKDWPISYDEIEPYYYEVEDTWGVAGSSDSIAPSDKIKYPMPEIPRSWLDKQLGASVEKNRLGPDSQTIPHCRNSEPRDGRPQCCGNSSCLPICPIGAKYDASVHVQKARLIGTHIHPNRVAYQVEVDDQQKVSGIYYKNFDNGNKCGSIGKAKAKVYILAAHAVETARLMLLSGGKCNVPEGGLSNSSDQVGRNLMGFANINTMGYAPDNMPVYPYRGPVSATGAFGQWRDGDFRKEHASIAPFILNFAFKAGSGPQDEAARGIARGLWGKALQEFIEYRIARQVNLHSTVEVLPDPENRITLSKTEMDPLGLPKPEVNFRLDAYTMKGCRVAWDWHMNVLKGAGIRTVMDTPMPEPTDENWEKFVRGDFDRPSENKDGFFSSFNMSLTSGDAVIAGTVCMGNDPTTAVVNQYSQSFDHDNLFVVGTANYLSVGSASPSLTAAALGLRSADHIARTFFEQLKRSSS